MIPCSDISRHVPLIWTNHFVAIGQKNKRSGGGLKSILHGELASQYAEQDELSFFHHGFGLVFMFNRDDGIVGSFLQVVVVVSVDSLFRVDCAGDFFRLEKGVFC